jgi:hypothetical protein
LTKSCQLKKSDCSWFERDAYEAQRQFALDDWATMLTLRVGARDNYQTHPIIDTEQKKQFWDQYSKFVSPKWSREKKPLGLFPALPWRGPALVDATHDTLGPEREKIVTWQVAMSGCRVLLVNPWASDDFLKEQFEKWLRQFRAEFHVPFKRRGRRGTNLGVTKLHFDTWANHSILAVFDLDFYAEVVRKRPLSMVDLYSLIGPTSKDAEEWAKEARKYLHAAVGGLEFLVVQAQSGAK